MSPELEERITKFARRAKKFTEIDLSRLEEEWVLQPKLVGEGAAIQAEVKKELAYAEAEMEMAEADVKFRIRKNPAKYGLDKPTDNPVKEAMVLHPLYQKAYKKVIEVKFAADVLVGSMNMLEHRKRSLEGLVSLHGQSYFAKPKVPQDAGEQFRNGVEGSAFRRKRKRKKIPTIPF